MTNKEQPMQPIVFRVADFLLRFDISKSSFYREVAAERLSIIKRGRRTLIARDEAERWFASLQRTKTKYPEPLIGTAIPPSATSGDAIHT